MNIFIEIIKLNMYMSLPIILFILFNKKLLVKYTAMFSYTLCLGIILRMMIVSKVNLNIPIIDNENIALSRKSYIFSDYIFENNFLKILFYIWIIGVVLISLYYIYCHIKFCNYITNLSKEILDTSIYNIFNDQKENLNIKKKFKLYVVEGIYSPAITGLRKNKIIIPNKKFKEKELKLIFRHELIHYKRKDNFLKLIMLIVNILYWFNPICYLLKKHFNELCELSCDELVIKGYNIDEVKDYAYVLLDTIKYKNKLKQSICISQFYTEKNSIIKRRLDRILNVKSQKRGLNLGLLISLVIIGSIFTFNLNINAQNIIISNNENGNIRYNKNGETYGTSIINKDGDIIEEPNLIYAQGENNVKGYVKKNDLYDEENQPQNPKEAVAYMKEKRKLSLNPFYKNTIPIYDKEG
ncbi:M56 family metallopeptidase, partial [Clostridioides difficile]